LFNEYYLGIITPTESKRLLEKQQVGTVVLRFAIGLAPNDFCFAIDSIHGSQNSEIRVCSTVIYKVKVMLFFI